MMIAYFGYAKRMPTQIKMSWQYNIYLYPYTEISKKVAAVFN